MGKVHYARCPNCGAAVHVTYRALGTPQAFFIQGYCEKCGKKIYTTTFWESDE